MFSDQEFDRLRIATQKAVDEATVKMTQDKMLRSRLDSKSKEKEIDGDPAIIRELEARIDHSKNESKAAHERAIGSIGQLRKSANEEYNKKLVFLDKLSANVRGN